MSHLLRCTITTKGALATVTTAPAMSLPSLQRTSSPIASINPRRALTTSPSHAIPSRSPRLGVQRPTKLSAVVLDVGGVLIPSYTRALDNLEKSLHLQLGSIERAMHSGNMSAWARLERGEFCADDPAFWAAFREDYEKRCDTVGGSSVDGRQVVEAIAAGIDSSHTLRANHTTAIMSLKAEGIKVAALTNNFKTTDGNTVIDFPRDLFDVVVESCKVGLRKPDPKIFEFTLECLGVPPSEAILLDDKRYNCHAAAVLGVYSVLVSSPSSTARSLTRATGFSFDVYYPGTVRAHGRHALDVPKLCTFFEENVPKFVPGGPLFVRKFIHGQSNPTYYLRSGKQAYVLRKKPPGNVPSSAHAIDREYRVLSALQKCGVPVPKPISYCEDSSVIGTPFYIMKFVDGRVLKNPALPDMTPTERQEIYRSMCSTLVDLHSVIPSWAGLSRFGKEGNYVQRQISRWTKQYRVAETSTIGAMEELITRLNTVMPRNIHSTTRLVHGDYRLDNLILEHDSPKVAAIIDWELSTLGDPLSDFAYHCMVYHIEADMPLLGGLAGLNLEELGIPTEEEYVAWYTKGRGLAYSSIMYWDFYLGLSFFRVAAIMQGVYARSLTGQGSSENGQAAGLMVEFMAQKGVDILKSKKRKPIVKL